MQSSPTRQVLWRRRGLRAELSNQTGILEEKRTKSRALQPDRYSGGEEDLEEIGAQRWPVPKVMRLSHIVFQKPLVRGGEGNR